MFKACKAHPSLNIRTAVILTLVTGARYSNIRYLKWDDVDMANWRLRFADTKNGEPRYIPLWVLRRQHLKNSTMRTQPAKAGYSRAA